MKRRFTAGQRDSERAEFFQFAQPFFQEVEWNRIADLIVLGTVAAGQIATADDYELSKERTVGQARKNSWCSKRGSRRICAGRLAV
jgi:hypothetical protein